jgi:hypothetical protein
MEKPNPNRFAERVLWYLCGVRAHCASLEILIAKQLSVSSGQSVESLLTPLRESEDKLHKELFVDAMASAGIPLDTHSPPPNETGEAHPP